MLTYSQKKYLFAIYKLGQNGKDVRSAEVAKIVGVSKASTVSMTQKLCDSGYIDKEHYGSPYRHRRERSKLTFYQVPYYP